MAFTTPTMSSPNGVKFARVRFLTLPPSRYDCINK